MLFGYIFWLIMSKITTPQVIGVSSTVVSLGAIFATVANIGIPIGVQRFLGKSFSERKLSDAKVYVKTSLLLTAIGIVACGTLILITYNWIHDTFRIDFSLIIVTISLIGSTAITTLLRSIVIASLKTKTLPIIMILSAIAKIVLGVILILIGVGALGIAISFTFYPILSSILLTISIVMIFKSLPNDKAEVSFGESFKNILVSGGASWIPYVIHTAASYLGPLLVFGSIGASQAGVYFIAYSLFTAIAAFMSVLFTIAYPVLSAMQEGRKKFAWRVTKMSLIMSLPLSYSVIFYSKQVMQLFGQDYAVGSSSLQILLLSMLPIVVMTGINTLVNAYGNYRQVLAIGVATNIPTAILYLIFIPIYDNSVGAAISYTFGSVIGFVVSVVIAKKIEMHIFWKDIAFILALPTGFGFLLSYFQVNYVIGISVTLAMSYLLLLRLHIITKIDIQDFLAIVPYSVANPILNLWNIVCVKLNKFRQ